MSKVVRKYYDNNHGWVIEKTNGTEDTKIWMAGQTKEKQITKKLHAISCPDYIVPKMLSIYKSRVHQTFIDGDFVSKKYFSGLSKEHQNRIARARMLFMADMASLRPVVFRDNFPNWNNVSSFMRNSIPTNLMGKTDMFALYEAVQLAKEYIDTRPFSRAKIFLHGDCSFNNEIYDIRRKRLGIIDFEFAGYEPLINALEYHNFGILQTLENIKDTAFAGDNSDILTGLSADAINAYKLVEGFYQNGEMLISCHKNGCNYNAKAYRNNFYKLMEMCR